MMFMNINLHINGGLLDTIKELQSLQYFTQILRNCLALKFKQQNYTLLVHLNILEMYFLIQNTAGDKCVQYQLIHQVYSSREY